VQSGAAARLSLTGGETRVKMEKKPEIYVSLIYLPSQQIPNWSARSHSLNVVSHGCPGQRRNSRNSVPCPALNLPCLPCFTLLPACRRLPCNDNDDDDDGDNERHTISHLCGIEIRSEIGISQWGGGAGSSGSSIHLRNVRSFAVRCEVPVRSRGRIVHVCGAVCPFVVTSKERPMMEPLCDEILT
jgi:hypothetical protein